MDVAVATLLGATIAGLTGIITVFLTNWFNLRQTNANLQSRLTEAAFNSRLQAYGELATAMQAVDFAVKQIAFAVNNRGRDFNSTLPNGSHAFLPGLEDSPVPKEMFVRLGKDAQTYLDTYYRTRMYLTPEMDATAHDFATRFILGIQLLPEPHEFTYEFAAGWLEHGMTYGPFVDQLTAEMRKYIASAEKGR